MEKNKSKNERASISQKDGTGVQLDIRDDEVIPSVEELALMNFDEQANWVKVIKNTTAFFDQRFIPSYIYEVQYLQFVEKHEREALIREHKMLGEKTQRSAL